VDSLTQLEESIALLERTPAALDGLLRGLQDGWVLQNEGAGTWSVFEVIGHLVHNERANWMVRARMILEIGAGRAFEPFDRTPAAGESLGELLSEFGRLRAENLAELRGLKLTAEQLALTGLHPAFGEVTLAQLLSTWAVHDLTHLTQIARVMAYQHWDAVGPWKEYLGVLRQVR
jgi:DinB superfamily